MRVVGLLLLLLLIPSVVADDADGADGAGSPQAEGQAQQQTAAMACPSVPVKTQDGQLYYCASGTWTQVFCGTWCDSRL